MASEGKRPLLMGMKPLWLREKIYYRFYRRRAALFRDLFQAAELEFARKVNLSLCQTDESHKVIAMTGFYELDVSKHIVSLGKEGGVLVDVGANYGYYSCMWAGIEKNNRVFAVEALPDNVRHLRENIRRNNLERQVKVLECAIGRKAGNMGFKIGPKEQTGWGGLTGSGDKEDFVVPVITLDELAKNRYFDHIDVLKVDVEGADYWVLRGARKLLEAGKIHHVFYEENIPRMNALGIHTRAAKQYLEGLGYRVIRLNRKEMYAQSA